jgi:hypothetical protein
VRRDSFNSTKICAAWRFVTGALTIWLILIAKRSKFSLGDP